MRQFYPTQWTLQYTSLTSILNGYEELQNFFSELSNTEKNGTGAKANRFMRQLDKADTFIMQKIICSILKYLKEANTIIQRKSLHLKACADIIDTLNGTIYNMREKFDSVMCEDLKENWKLLGLNEPKGTKEKKATNKI